MCQEDFGDELMTIPHEVVRTSGLPGVYDILQCKQCGLACRVSPVEVTFGRYQPDGGVLWKFDKVECTAALNHPDAELYPAYDYLFKMFKKSNEFRDVFPGHWPQIDVGIWGTPMIRLWDGWSIELDQCVVQSGIRYRIVAVVMARVAHGYRFIQWGIINTFARMDCYTMTSARNHQN
jgi:hypothetical protein